LPAVSNVAPVPSPEAPGAPAREGRRFRTATGVVESYDPASRVLVVASITGEESFFVAPEARLWIGSRRAAVDRLAASAGAQVTVAWSVADGCRTTHTVRLARGRGDRER
jgi:hypothetical protein